MYDRNEIIRNLEALGRELQKNHCYECCYEFIQLGKTHGTSIAEKAAAYLKGEGGEREAVYADLKALRRAMSEKQCFACVWDYVDEVKECTSAIVDEAIWYMDEEGKA